jgi:hypothetical protein
MLLPPRCRPPVDGIGLPPLRLVAIRRDGGAKKPVVGVYRCAGGDHSEMVRHDNGVAVDRVAAAVDVALDLFVLAAGKNARLRRVNPYGNRCGNMTAEPRVTDPPGAACV